jgi:hypothetical protein
LPFGRTIKRLLNADASDRGDERGRRAATGAADVDLAVDMKLVERQCRG